jgi:glucokinase
MLRVGVDIGGTNIKIGIIEEEDGRIIDKREIPFTHQGYESVFAQIQREIREMLKEGGFTTGQVGSIGLAVPGSIDVSNGSITHAYNLDFHDVPAVEEMEKTFPETPIYLANDANAAALGELHCGVFKGYKTAVLLTIGTGVGGGVILGGKMFNGGQNHGVELGHMMLKYGGIRCSCGNYGCVESYCTATWLIQEGKKLMEEGIDSLVCTRGNWKPENVDAKLIIDAARDGDPHAQKIFDTFIDNLSAAITSINAILDPEIIAIGGGVSGAGEILFEPLREKVEEKSFFDFDYKIVPAYLGNDAGIVGAAMLHKNGASAERRE